MTALRQSILHLAVRGALVSQDPADEPASKLLERIAKEKARLVKEGKIKKAKPLPPVGGDEKPFELPEGWEWARVGALSFSSDSGWSPSCENRPREKEEWGVLKISAITWGKYNPSENKALPLGLSPRPECEVKEGDYLISRANTADLVARSVIVKTTPPKLMMCDKIVRFRFSPNTIIDYVYLVNNNSSSREYYSRNATGTSDSMRNISRDCMYQLPIPLPPLNEQKRIVVKVRQLMALCDDLENALRRQRDAAAALAEAAVRALA